MFMLQMLLERALPPLLTREKMLEILQNEVYGKLPERPEKLTFSIVEEELFRNFCAGKAVCSKLTANCMVNGKPFSFPFYATLPTSGKQHPFFIHISFRDWVPDRYMPTEELIDNGFAIFSFGYEDITTDDGDFTNGLAGVLYENGIRQKGDAGKIAMWAWAAQRVMDYAVTCGDLLDLKGAVVCGHSRLGKTALFTAATDERFPFAYSNDSGCSGAAITRGKEGEHVKEICTRFPYWFCENYQAYIENEEAMPFDQHFLVASIAPRRVLIGSAAEDRWADPVSEQLCCFAASPAFPQGFIGPDRPASAGEAFLEGDIGYQLRKGTHYFSRVDWQRLIQFVDLHRGR